MASISSLMSSSSSSSIYGSRSSNIISGLASGMDTESMIEGMVQGIKSKIDKQKQQKTLLGWQQQAYRGISNQLINLSTKYMSYISNSNLMGSEVFGSSIITSLGTYADRISASGTTNSNIQITGATMATNASVTFDGIAGAQISDTISSGEIDLNGTTPVSNFAGKSITFEYDSRAITVNFPADAKYSSKEDVANEIKKQFDEQMKVAGMEGKVDISVSASGEIKFDNKGGGVFKVTAGSDKTLGALGLKADQDLSSGATVQVGDLDENVKNIDLLKGKTLSVTFGDKSTTLTIPDDAKDADSIINSLQSQIDKAFGYAGGLVGENKGTIANSSVCNVSFEGRLDGIGGLCGHNYLYVINSYASSCQFTKNASAGGLCYNMSSDAVLTNCYVHAPFFNGNSQSALFSYKLSAGMSNNCFYPKDTGLKEFNTGTPNEGKNYAYDTDFTVADTDTDTTLLDALNAWVDKNQGKYAFTLQHWETGPDGNPVLVP